MASDTDWEKIRKMLAQLRASRPELHNYALFKKASGINRATVEATESGDNRPGLEIIEKWVTACGKTLSEFFSQLEKEPTEKEVRLAIGFEDWYSLLTEIIESGQDFFKAGIHANLLAMRNEALRQKEKITSTKSRDGPSKPRRELSR